MAIFQGSSTSNFVLRRDKVPRANERRATEQRDRRSPFQTPGYLALSRTYLEIKRKQKEDEKKERRRKREREREKSRERRNARYTTVCHFSARLFHGTRFVRNSPLILIASSSPRTLCYSTSSAINHPRSRSLYSRYCEATAEPFEDSGKLISRR